MPTQLMETSAKRYCDFHTHILPGIDDGASSVKTSLKMLSMLKHQHVTDVCLTPHFDFRKESREQFLKRREKSFDSLNASLSGDVPRLYLGAEIYLSKGISDCVFDGLYIGSSDILLVEFPRTAYQNWMLDEIEKLLFKRQIKVMIAHIDRVIKLYSESVCNDIFDYTDLVFQINTSSVKGLFPSEKLVTRCVDGISFVLGTDSHGALVRAPSYAKAVKCLNGAYYRNTLNKSISAASDKLVKLL